MKQYILDTTVLLYEPQALFSFKDNDVIIPIVVIEDIDRFKKDMSETGRNARQTSRQLDTLRQQGPLTGGVNLPGGGRLFVRMCPLDVFAGMPVEYREHRRDNIILAMAREIRRSVPDRPTVIVTKDINLRIRGDALGLTVEDFESDKVDIEELYCGTATVAVETRTLDRFNTDSQLPVKGALAAMNLMPNQYVVMTDKGKTNRMALARFDSASSMLVRLQVPGKDELFRLASHNHEQSFAIDALLNDKIMLVTLVGKAGTGKTLLAVAAAIYKTVAENTYNRILISRPVLPMGKDIGFLPGTVEDKLTPWMYPIADNVEFLMRGDSRSRRKGPGFKELIDMGILVIEPLTYIRGRSIHNQFLIVDEAQNLTPHEIKTIITRVGDGTKIVVTGDPYQIDNPYIDSSSNGLAYVVERFRNQPISAHVTLTHGERSALSELAANIL